MTQTKASLRTPAIARAALVAAVVLGLDQLTKHTVAAGIATGESKKFLPGVTLVHYRNTGVAFSIFSQCVWFAVVRPQLAAISALPLGAAELTAALERHITDIITRALAPAVETR